MSRCHEPDRRIRRSSAEAVALVRSGVPLKQVAADLGVSEQTLRNWRRQGDVDATPRA